MSQIDPIEVATLLSSGELRLHDADGGYVSLGYPTADDAEALLRHVRSAVLSWGNEACHRLDAARARTHV
jgi:hypothetical protein